MKAREQSAAQQLTAAAYGAPSQAQFHEIKHCIGSGHTGRQSDRHNASQTEAHRHSGARNAETTKAAAVNQKIGSQPARNGRELQRCAWAQLSPLIICCRLLAVCTTHSLRQLKTHQKHTKNKSGDKNACERLNMKRT